MIRVNDWIGFKDGLDKETCDKIIKIAEDKLIETSEEGTIDRHIENHKDFKISDMIWTEEKWIYDVIWPYMTQANNQAGWKYDIKTSEYLQIARYQNGMFYDWHPDNKLMHGHVRKLSMGISLNNDFEGGEFQFAKYEHQESEPENKWKDRNVPDSNIETVEMKRGSIIIFPSDMWHRVKPVTKGIRYSLVAWFLGPPFS